MTCHLRPTECSCNPDECKSDPKLVSPAPIIRPTQGDTWALIAFVVVMAGITYGCMSAANSLETQYRQEARV